MRILSDENFPGVLVNWLTEEGHDVVWARLDCANDAGHSDGLVSYFSESIPTGLRILRHSFVPLSNLTTIGAGI